MKLSKTLKLQTSDYIKILNYYDISIPTNKSQIKTTAEDILADKLCRCIKKVGLKNEPKSIGICTKNVFNKKGLSRGQFNCKGKRSVTISKTRKNKK
jgi:hypothetical protein